MKYLIRRSIDKGEQFIGWLHRRQMIEPSIRPVKLNLGSGLHVAPGWINVDNSVKTLFSGLPKPLLRWAYQLATVKDTCSCDEFVALLKNHQFIFHDLKYEIPLRDSSVDFIFVSHVLHHLYLTDAAHLIHESQRVLKPGGVLRIAVPDLEYIVRCISGRKARTGINVFLL